MAMFALTSSAVKGSAARRAQTFFARACVPAVSWCAVADATMI